MATTKTRRDRTADKRDIYQETTDRIIASLEAGTIPWQKPWHNVGGELPYSIGTGKPYRGINVFMLMIESMTEGYTDPRWGTYKAITEAGGQVRKGEKGTRVILWKPVHKKGEDENGDEEKRDYLLLRDFVVFNAEQADGLPELPKPELREHSTNEICEQIIHAYCDEVKMIRKQPVHGPKLAFGGDRAFYNFDSDTLRVPQLGQFDSADDYYATSFHELVHSTGHEKRLQRVEKALFGSDPYAKEELVAELGASMISAIAGLDADTLSENQAAYIANWLQKLRDDKKLIIQAAAQAQKAADMILGTTFEKEESTDLQEVAA